MPERPQILVVDLNRRNLELLAGLLGKAGYESMCANSIEDFDQALESLDNIDLALVDLANFGGHIWDRCDRLRKAQIPFLIISAGHLEGLQQDGVTHGARAVLTKPLASRKLLGMIRSLLEASV